MHRVPRKFLDSDPNSRSWNLFRGYFRVQLLPANQEPQPLRDPSFRWAQSRNALLITSSFIEPCWTVPRDVGDIRVFENTLALWDMIAKKSTQQLTGDLSLGRKQHLESRCIFEITVALKEMLLDQTQVASKFPGWSFAIIVLQSKFARTFFVGDTEVISLENQ